MTITTEEIIPTGLATKVDVPVLTGLQRQGDIMLIPQRTTPIQGQPIPSEGVALVRGEAGGNTHLLLPSDGVTFHAPIGNGPSVGVIDVAEGSTAYIHHPEHGYVGVGAGSYGVRRQVERAEEIRLVAD